MDALAAVAVWIVEQAAYELIDVAHVARIVDSALPPDRLAGVLRTAGALGVSVGDRPRLTKTLAAAVACGLADRDVAELVVSRLRLRRVRIEASPAYLERIASLVAAAVAVHGDFMPVKVQEPFALLDR